MAGQENDEGGDEEDLGRDGPKSCGIVLPP